ncbi:hypothetical protein HYH03_017409 [Edaphochlamys debaryana]|uniref:Uncharacterized protein n=1 Tax=Edaphochlamys debaryana TaxID=47281 RepID=A0A835XPD8_9CHLO|nr:hypothetical protein HYH03_017409 [Edaphochlamys debaryana]|eukprot:KAG2483754.1 hypothetical protein HYH03_017409 [Edaphochlamys debaryana]
MWKTINVGRNIQALAANVPLTFLENAWGSLDINSAETGRPGDRTLILDEVDRTMSRNMLAFQIKKALLSIDLFNNIDRRVSYLYPPWVSPQNEAAFKKYGEEMQQEAIQAQLEWERNRAAAGLPSTAAE